MESVGQDLIESMKEVQAFVEGKHHKCKAYIPDEINTKRIRNKLHMSQREFAEHYKFNFRTLQEWEQGNLVPSPNQQIFLRVIDCEADAVERVLNMGINFA